MIPPENFTPVRNPATVSCKRGATNRMNVTSGRTGTGSACVNFVNSKWHVFVKVKWIDIHERITKESKYTRGAWRGKDKAKGNNLLAS